MAANLNKSIPIFVSHSRLAHSFSHSLCFQFGFAMTRADVWQDETIDINWLKTHPKFNTYLYGSRHQRHTAFIIVLAMTTNFRSIQFPWNTWPKPNSRWSNTLHISAFVSFLYACFCLFFSGFGWSGHGTWLSMPP